VEQIALDESRRLAPSSPLRASGSCPIRAPVLHIENTGYEGKFDFPKTSEPPRLVYMLATMPRTGSTFLSHLLWKTGGLGAPLEYLNFDPEGPYFFATEAPDVQLKLWHSVLMRRTSPNGVFGFKCFPVQLHLLQENNPQLLSLVRPAKFIYLQRRDRAKHVVSYARSFRSGVWRHEQDRGQSDGLDYSQQDMDEVNSWIDQQSRGWEEMFRRQGHDPLRLWYEDVVADPQGTIARVANFLGISVSDAAEPFVPSIHKQSFSKANEWEERYRSSGAASG